MTTIEPGWHHADQLQARIAASAGYDVRVSDEIGWEVFATDADFGTIVIDAGERR